MEQDVYFDIKSYNDVYSAVGKIIEASQELEQTFKEYANCKNVNIENVGTATLNKLNNEFYKNKFYDEKLYKDLKTIIEKRNYINHEIFVELKKTTIREYDKISNELNNILFLIYEASDFIQNFIDEINGQFGNRPTIFDRKNY